MSQPGSVPSDQDDGEAVHTDRRAAARLERDRQIVDRSIAGNPVIDIGRDHGFVSPGPAMRLVERSLDLMLPELDTDLQRRLDLARLERLLAVWWSRAVADDAEAAALVLGLLRTKSLVRGEASAGSDR